LGGRTGAPARQIGDALSQATETVAAGIVEHLPQDKQRMLSLAVLDWPYCDASLLSLTLTP